MKKTVLLMLCLLLALLLCACGNDTETLDIPGGDFSGEPPSGAPSDMPSGAPGGGTSSGASGTSGSKGSGQRTQSAGSAAEEVVDMSSVNAASMVEGRVESIVGNEITFAEATTDGDGETTYAEDNLTTYLLPVGMPIGTGDFSSVTSGASLRLMLDADGKVVAASILRK